MLRFKLNHVSKRGHWTAEADRQQNWERKKILRVAGLPVIQQYPIKFKNFSAPWNLSVWYKTKFGSQNLATKFGVFFMIYVMFHKYVQCGSSNDGTKYCGCGIPLNWDMSFGKFGGLPTLVAFQKINLQGRTILSGLLLADCKRLHPIVITFNTLCLVELHIK